MEPVAGMDKLFFNLEKSSRTMNIMGCWLFEEDLHIEEVEAEFEKLATHFPRFRQAIHWQNRQPYWCQSPDFNVKQQIKESTLSGEAGNVQLAEFIASVQSQLLPHSQPLWQAHLLHNLKLSGSDSLCRSAVITVVHHAVT